MTAPHRLHHMGYAVVRMPTLPVRDWLAHAKSARAAGAGVEAAWQRRADSAHRLFLRPVVAEAIYLASPGFHARLSTWDWQLRGGDDRKMLASFERYLNRMCFRCTPFGLFSTVSYARLQHAPGTWTLDAAAAQARIERTVRIDGEALGALCGKTGRESAAQSHYTLNASLYAAGDNYRYHGWSSEPGKERVYELAEIDRHPLIDEVVRQTDGSALSIAELESRLQAQARADDIDLPALIADLVDAKVLVPAISLDPLSPNPARALGAALAAEGVHDAAGDELLRLERALRAIPAGAELEHYRRMDAQLRELTGIAPSAQSIQVDAFRMHDAMAVDAAQVEAAVDAIGFLADRFSTRSGMLDAFCTAFGKRYGCGPVPLMEALDDEIGIGYEPAVAPDSPAARFGIRRRSRRGAAVHASPFDEFLLGLVQRDPSLLASGEIAFGRRDVEHLSPATDAAWGPGMQAVLQFPRMGGERVAVFVGANTSGAVHAMSRFCHGDERLHEAACEYARLVEAESGKDVVHAEISYLPKDRSANVLTRPRIWTYRIDLVEPAIEPGEFDLPVSDLMLTVNGKDIRLWSRRLGKRVIPHLTSAHNPQQRGNLSTWKFLAALQGHGTPVPQLEWGALFRDFEYRPRLRFEDLVLAPARWHLRAGSLAALRSQSDSKQEAALRTLLAERRAPRRIELEEQDNRLVLDLDDTIDLGHLLRLVRKGRDLVFCELLDDFGDDGLVDGKQAWRHELVVPLYRPGTLAALPAQPPACERDLARVPAARALYVKLYGAHERLDSRMLPLALEWLAAQRSAGLVGQWFFIRYADPDWHLRLRVFPAPGKHAQVLARLMELAEQAQDGGFIHRFEFTAYEREMARYGGLEHIERNEALFCIDSELAARILHGGVFSEAAPARWSIAMVAIDALLRDFGLPLERKLSLMAGAAASFKQEFSVDKVRLGDLYRTHGRDLVAALERSAGAPRWSLELCRLLDSVSLDRRALARPILSDPPTPQQLDIVASQVHMLCNRLFASHGREHEVLVYDYLARAYRSLAARTS